ncbi:MAG: hypothetical protein IJK64_11115 [Clostridia bacterium]|nr:hypothetical protein [Clostridia bacterium]
MFVLISDVPAPRSRRQARRLQARLRRTPAKLNTEANALPFLTESVCAAAPAWDAVAAHCGRYAACLLAPETLPLPPDSRFRRYDPAAFRAQVLFRAACALLKAAALPPQRLTVTLCDRSGLLASQAPALLPFAAGLRILTSAPARYIPVCVSAMQTAGATLLLRDRYRPAPGPELLLCCSGVPPGVPASACLLTAQSADTSATVLTGHAFSLRPTHAALLPDGVDALAFAGALTETCACPDYRDAVFSDLAAASDHLRAWFAAADSGI